MHAAGRARPCVNRLGDLVEDMDGRRIPDQVDGVESETVKVILLEPEERVLAEERAHLATAGPVEVDRPAPRRRAPGAEERGRVPFQVVPLGPEVVVHDIEKHGDPARVAGLNQRLERLGTTVPAVGREW